MTRGFAWKGDWPAGSRAHPLIPLRRLKSDLPAPGKLAALAHTVAIAGPAFRPLDKKLHDPPMPVSARRGCLRNTPAKTKNRYHTTTIFYE